MEKSVAIVGLGALGSAFAALLARAGIPVAGVCRWREHREAIQADGLLLREDAAEARVRFPVTEVLPRGQEFRLVIVLAKSFDTQTVAEGMAGRIDSHTPVLTLQNGLGNAEALAAHLQPGQILAGATTFGALREAPGQVRLTGRGECQIGAWKGTGERYLPQTQDLFQRAGLDCRRTTEVAAALWKKLAVNAAINPLTAILRVRNGELLERKGVEPVVGMVAEEVWRVAARLQIELPTPLELLEEIRRVCRVTAANRSSMLRDLEEKRRTEIDAINGAVARLGRDKGVMTPINAALAGLIQALTSPSGSVPESKKEEK